MRNVLLYLYLFILIFTSCKKYSIDMVISDDKDLFILAKNQNYISLNLFENEEIIEIKSFKKNNKSIYATDNRRRVVIVDTSQNNLSIFDIKSRTEIKLIIPFKIKPKTVLINQNNLFLGGELEDEMLIQYNFKDTKWYSLEIPTKLLSKRKAIDDFVVNDSLLIAIDNIVMPKYLIYYKLPDSEKKLILDNFYELKSNGTYEVIHKGRMCSKYLGLYSKTMSGYVGSTEHITIYDGLDLNRSFAISSNKKDRNYHTFNDFILKNNKVIIASKENGLGILEIKESYFSEQENNFDIFNSRIDLRNIKYQKYNGNIVGLTSIPKTNKMILSIMKNFKVIEHIIIEI